MTDTITLEDKINLLELQSESWLDFVQKMLAVTEDHNFNINHEANVERELISNVLENVKICQKFYMNIYDFCANSFNEYNLSSPTYFWESIKSVMRVGWRNKDFETLSTRELFKYFDLYYFQDGILPTRHENIKLPEANKSQFFRRNWQGQSFINRLTVWSM